MNNTSISKASFDSAIEKVDHLIRIAKEGIRYGANEEVFPWQSQEEFDSDYANGLREELIREYGGNPFTRQSWNQHGEFYYLDDEEKKPFGSYQDYVEWCDAKCQDIFRDIIDSLVKYKDYLCSIAE